MNYRQMTKSRSATENDLSMRLGSSIKIGKAGLWCSSYEMNKRTHHTKFSKKITEFRDNVEKNIFLGIPTGRRVLRSK